MRSSLLSMAVISALAGLLLAADPGGEKPAPPTAPAEKKTDSKPKKVKRPPADNSRCLVCHINYEEEELAVKHARRGYGCVHCHGESPAHSADEDNITPPEKMYAKGRINGLCMHCHKTGKRVPDDKSHKEALDGTALKDKYCTDCHGEHEMSYRTKAWDKETGKLLPTPARKDKPAKKK